MVYDQGMAVETEDFRFVANFKYTVKPGSYYFLEELGVSSYGDFDTRCDQTMVGFVQTKNETDQLACFYGEKTTPSEQQTTEELL